MSKPTAKSALRGVRHSLKSGEVAGDVIDRAPLIPRPMLTVMVDLEQTRQGDKRFMTLKADDMTMSWNGVFFNTKGTYFMPRRRLDGVIEYPDGWDLTSTAGLVAPSGMTIDANFTVVNRNGVKTLADGRVLLPSGEQRDGHGPIVCVIHGPDSGSQSGSLVFGITHPELQASVGSPTGHDSTLPARAPAPHAFTMTIASSPNPYLADCPMQAPPLATKFGQPTISTTAVPYTVFAEGYQPVQYISPYTAMPGIVPMQRLLASRPPPVPVLETYQASSVPVAALQPAVNTIPPAGVSLAAAIRPATGTRGVTGSHPGPGGSRRTRLALHEIVACTPTRYHGQLEPCDFDSCGVDELGIPLCMPTAMKSEVCRYVIIELKRLNGKV